MGYMWCIGDALEMHCDGTTMYQSYDCKLCTKTYILPKIITWLGDKYVRTGIKFLLEYIKEKCQLISECILMQQ